MTTAPDASTPLLDTVTAMTTKVCPVAPPGAQQYAASVGGRVFAMPHASKAGVVGVVLVFVAIIAYLVLPGIVRAMTGSGCV